MRLVRRKHLQNVGRRLRTLFGKEDANRLKERLCMMIGRYGVGDQQFAGPRTLE